MCFQVPLNFTNRSLDRKNSLIKIKLKLQNADKYSRANSLLDIITSTKIRRLFGFHFYGLIIN